MDLEDLFSEQEGSSNNLQANNEPLIVPSWGPCGGEEEEEEKKESNCQSQDCCKKEKGFKKNQCSKEEEKVIPSKEVDRKSKYCYKCKVKVANFTHKSDKICKECFFEFIVHRFKSSLRQNLKIWKDDLNLVCVSGGSNSMALLHLMHQSLFGNQSNRKMFFQVHILYIDEGAAVYGWSEEERQKNLSLIKAKCQEYNFSYTIVPIESIFDIEGSKIDLKGRSESENLTMEEEKKLDEENHSQPVNLEPVRNQELKVVGNVEEYRPRFQKLITSLDSLSNFREDLILYMKKWIIVEFALNYNFKKILLGTSGHKVATQLLAQLAKGRGVSISYEISYIDDKNFGSKLTFMNPMREFLQKEISLYNHLNKVGIQLFQHLEIFLQKSLAQQTNPNTSAPCFGSSDYLIESFFNMLQDQYNVNTVPTVIRLTNKLLKPALQGSSPDKLHIFCPLCLGVRDQVNNLLEMGSTIKQIRVEGDQNIPVSITSSDDWLVNDIEKAFCFGCKRMSISAKMREQFIEQLPQIVKDNAARCLLEIL